MVNDEFNQVNAVPVSTKPFARIRFYWATILVFCLLMGATLAISLQEFHAAEVEAERQLQLTMHGTGQEVIEDFREYEEALTTARGFVAASNHVSRDEWATFFESSSLHEQFPGVSGFAYVQKVTQESSESFVNEIREDIPWYTIHPPLGSDQLNHQDDHYLIKYFYPEPANKRVFGLDIAAKSVSKMALDYAARNNSFAISKPLHLYRKKKKQWGLLIAMPLYSADPAGLTPDQRLENCTSWVACPLELKTFFESEADEDYHGFHITLSSTNEFGSSALLYNSDSSHTDRVEDNIKHAAVEFEFGGQPFLLGIHCCDQGFIQPQFTRANIVSLASTLFALVLTAVVFVSSRTGIHARRIALEMTQTIRKKERQHQILVAQANTANSSKSMFLANMSHEIRTPLTAILGYTEVLGDQLHEETNTQDLHHSLDCIHRSGEHLREIINDILDLSKIDAGKIDLHPSDCNLPNIIAEVVESFQVKAQGKGLDLDVQIDSPVPETILADKLRLRQILINLIGNAIKFTDIGSITLHLAHENDSMAICVRDTGIGIPDDAMKNLFRPFEQVDNSSTRLFDGTGLGLTISQKIARLMRGEITAESTPRVGSAFTFCFPVETDESTVYIQSISNAITASHTNTTPTDLVGRVLVVEDGLDNQRLIAHFLRRSGLRVEFASNGKIAQDAILHDGRFDVILMDMQMPVQDGYKTVSNLRKLGYKMPIIALTAHAMHGDREKCIAAGCSDFLTKPINREHMISTTRRHIDPITPSTNAA